jgi:hypothetical protein
MQEMFISPNFAIDEQMLIDAVSEIQQPSDIDWKHLLMADYVYHHQDADYDGGLSFLDRLNKKLGHRHSDWDIDAFKDWIRTHVESPTSAYALVISDMLANHEDVEYYGL